MILASSTVLSIPQRVIAYTQAFPAMCEHICADIARYGYIPFATEQQPEMYKVIQLLKSFSINTNVVASTSIVQWVQTLACCPTGYMLSQARDRQLYSRGILPSGNRNRAWRRKDFKE